MSAGFGVGPDDLAGAAGRLDEAARIAADTLATLRATLDGLGDPLGDDEQGRTVAARHDPAAADGLAAIAREAASLGVLGEALRRTAAAHRELDDRAAGAPPER